MDHIYWNNNSHYIKTLAKIENIRWKEPNETIPECATAICDQLEIFIPLAGLIDKTAELARLNKEIEKLEKIKMQTESRLSNPTFTKKAPEKVVGEVRMQLENCSQTLEKLREQIVRIAQL